MLGRYLDGLLWLSAGHGPDALPREPAHDAAICRQPPAALIAAERELDDFAARLAGAVGDAGVARALVGRDD
jgi:hypothetical protein